MSKTELTVFTTRNSMKYRTLIQVNGRNERIAFEPSIYFGRVGESTYATCNNAIIEALKKHPRYGEVFFLKDEGGKPEEPEVTPPPPVDDETVDPLAELKKLLPDADNALMDDTVTSKATAIAWLQANKGATFTEPTATVAVLKEEAARVHNVIFTKWQ